MKKIIILLLSALMLLTLFSCSDNNGASNTASQQVNTSNDDTSFIEKYAVNVPEGFSYNGETVEILTTCVSPDDQKYTEFGYNELDSSVINDAVADRNLAVEQLLDCKIVERLVERLTFSSMNIIRSESYTGNAKFKIASPALLEASILAEEGYFYNLYSLENMNGLKDPWWDSYFTKSAELLGKIYFATGDIGFRTRDSLPAIYFNKDLVAQYELGDPYDMVKNKQWTLDIVTEWSKEFSEDLDNNNIIDYKDKFGMGGQLDNIWSCYYGSGELLVRVNSEGKPEIAFTGERAVTVAEKIAALMQDKNCFVSANDYFNDGGGYKITPMEYITTAFSESRSILLSSTLAALEALRDMTVDFGILPTPLFDENQDSYYSLINPWGANGFCIPSYLSEEEAELASVLLNALGAEGKNTVRPAYYEVCLKGQRSRDDESQEMLDIIIDTAGCDIGFIFNWNNIIYRILHDTVSNTPGSYVSNAQQYISGTNAAIDLTISNFEALD